MLPSFGLIKSIFILNNEPFIVYNLFNTTYYDDHYGVFNVKLTSELNYLK